MREALIRDGVVIDLRDRGSTVADPVAAAAAFERRHRDVRLLAVALLVLLNVADLVTTNAFLDAGVPEGNPLGEFLISRGWVGWVKAGILLALTLRILQRPPRLGTTAALWFVTGVYAAVVLVNLMVLNAA